MLCVVMLCCQSVAPSNGHETLPFVQLPLAGGVNEKAFAVIEAPHYDATLVPRQSMWKRQTDHTSGQAPYKWANHHQIIACSFCGYNTIAVSY